MHELANPFLIKITYDFVVIGFDPLFLTSLSELFFVKILSYDVLNPIKTIDVTKILRTLHTPILMRSFIKRCVRTYMQNILNGLWHGAEVQERL